MIYSQLLRAIAAASGGFPDEYAVRWCRSAFLWHLTGLLAACKHLLRANLILIHRIRKRRRRLLESVVRRACVSNVSRLPEVGRNRAHPRDSASLLAFGTAADSDKCLLGWQHLACVPTSPLRAYCQLGRAFSVCGLAATFALSQHRDKLSFLSVDRQRAGRV